MIKQLTKCMNISKCLSKIALHLNSEMVFEPITSHTSLAHRLLLPVYTHTRTHTVLIHSLFFFFFAVATGYFLLESCIMQTLGEQK